MHYDKIERSVCTVLSAGYVAQLGMHHPYKAGLFNMLATVRGPCGQDPSTCLINVASPTMPVQSSSPLTNDYSITDLNRMSQTQTVCMVCTLGENVRLMRKRYAPTTTVMMLYLYFSLSGKCYRVSAQEPMK